MHKYCFKCGAKMSYSAREKPKFCQNCGVALGGTHTASKDTDLNDSGEGNSAGVVFERGFDKASMNIDSLDFEFDASVLKVKSQKIQDVMGTLDEVSNSKNLPPRPKISKEESRAQFEKEAGTLRESKRPRGSEENG